MEDYLSWFIKTFAIIRGAKQITKLEKIIRIILVSLKSRFDAIFLIVEFFDEPDLTLIQMME